MIQRDSLKTDLGKALYDWSPLPNKSTRVEIDEEIVLAFCTREKRKCLESSLSGLERHVVIDGESTLQLYQEWLNSFMDFGYEPPLLICDGD